MRIAAILMPGDNPSVLGCNTMYDPKLYVIGFGLLAGALAILLFIFRKKIDKTFFCFIFLVLLFAFLSYSFEFEDLCGVSGDFKFWPEDWIPGWVNIIAKYFL